MTAIVDIHARQILDSRGNPTVEVDVTLEDGSMGRAAVPSGASTGAHEAVEMRDGDKSRWGGKGVERGGALRSTARSPTRSSGSTPRTRPRSTRAMIDARRHRQQGRARRQCDPRASAWRSAKAAADARGLPLYRYVGGVGATLLPVPMMNILNGGAHADNPIDFQEFMVMPVGAPTFSEALRCGAEIFHALKSALHAKGLSTAVGDEGGFAPEHRLGPRGARLHPEAVESAGYTLGERRAARARLRGDRILQGRRLRAWQARGGPSSPDEMADYLAELAADYPIASIEDGMAEDDMAGWKALTERLGGRVQLVGDDLFVTNEKRLAEGIDDGIANSILVKVNQIGTLTETIDAVRLAQSVGLHRGDVAPLGRDRGFDHRRPRGRSVAAGRSRPAAWRAPTAPPSTTSCCGSRRSWATPRVIRACRRCEPTVRA